MATNWKLLLNEMWDDQIIKCYWTFWVSQLFFISLSFFFRSFFRSRRIVLFIRYFVRFGCLCVCVCFDCCLFLLICTQNDLNLRTNEWEIGEKGRTIFLYRICLFHRIAIDVSIMKWASNGKRSSTRMNKNTRTHTHTARPASLTTHRVKLIQADGRY